MQAAHERFERDGYEAARIDDIAAAAGVAVPTVYKVFTNKRKLLAAVVEAAMSGDVDAPVAQQPWWREQITEPSAARQLRLIARNARQIYDRAGLLLELLRGAATADPEVQAVVRRLEEERHRRGRLSARALVDKRALRPGMTAAEAARTLWILTAPELYLRQVRELGLTADAFERWLASLLQHALLPD
ncbi:MAG TPA: TetR family transcriptional regulator [Chloroflexota bacterium]